jgi:CelD/BcsL family acetyltransferase involved in cellulose biosynthesis
MRITPGGPPPRDPRTRRRTNKPSVHETEVIALPVRPQRKADPTWLPEIQELWESLPASGQSSEFQESDWAFAWLLMGVLQTALTERNRTTGTLTASLISNALSQLARLGVTVADRKRLGLILTQEHKDATITEIQAGYRKLQAVKDS